MDGDARTSTKEQQRPDAADQEGELVTAATGTGGREQAAATEDKEVEGERETALEEGSDALGHRSLDRLTRRPLSRRPRCAKLSLIFIVFLSGYQECLLA